VSTGAADNGHLETAYRVLLSTSLPSWLGMLERGATTIWERWDGVGGSLNHYSKGAVASFRYTHVAGLRPITPGYRRFAVEPRPGGGPGRHHFDLEPTTEGSQTRTRPPST
jgi:alpha-L-rhamnosidase